MILIHNENQLIMGLTWTSVRGVESSTNGKSRDLLAFFSPIVLLTECLGGQKSLCTQRASPPPYPVRPTAAKKPRTQGDQTLGSDGFARY